MPTTRKVKNSSDRRTAVGPTGTEKEVEYTLQNGGDSWFQELLNEFPTLRSRSNVVKRRLAEQHKNEWESMQGGLDLDGISDKISGMSYKGSSTDLDSQYGGFLSGGEDDSLNEISGELSSPLDEEDQWVQRNVDEEAIEMDDARESYLGDHGMESSGMTNNAFGVGDSSLSKMSPNQKMAMVGLLKDFMSPAPDDPVPQIRGAGIIKGGGTPFPSLLAKKPERQRYVNKGLL
jgi:hypothetical protein